MPLCFSLCHRNLFILLLGIRFNVRKIEKIWNLLGNLQIGGNFCLFAIAPDSQSSKFYSLLKDFINPFVFSKRPLLLSASLSILFALALNWQMFCSLKLVGKCRKLADSVRKRSQLEIIRRQRGTTDANLSLSEIYSAGVDLASIIFKDSPFPQIACESKEGKCDRMQCKQSLVLSLIQRSEYRPKLLWKSILHFFCFLYKMPSTVRQG